MTTIVFTGHMIDRPGRAIPRFPPQLEPAARHAIAQELLAFRASVRGTLQALSGGACGGDILFLECCREQGVEARMILALAPEPFREQSVAFAGADWNARYDALLQGIPYDVLPDTNVQPGEDVWEATNRCLLERATTTHAVLLALWDGNPGDGSGGTTHMIAQARQKKVPVHLINLAAL